MQRIMKAELFYLNSVQEQLVHFQNKEVYSTNIDFYDDGAP